MHTEIIVTEVGETNEYPNHKIVDHVIETKAVEDITIPKYDINMTKAPPMAR